MIEPARVVTDPVQRATARGLSALFVSILGVLFLMSAIWPWCLEPKAVMMAETTSLLTAAAIFGLYVMSKTRYFNRSGELLWVLSIASVTFSAAFQPDHEAAIEAARYLTISVFVMNAVFSLKMSLLLLPLYPAITLAFAYFRKDFTSLDSIHLVTSIILSWTVTFFLALKRQEVDRIIELQKQSMIAVSKFAALGEMAGGIAHEVNNPLMIIEGSMYKLRMMVDENQFEPEKVHEECDRVSANIRRISNIVRGLRVFARDGRKDPFALVPIQVLIEESAGVLHEKLKVRKIELSCSPEPVPADWKIECRAIQICQILVNLIGNAMDAVQNLPEKWIRIEIRQAGDLYEFRVTDSGQGIPKKVLDKIFHPFFTTKEVGKGTGMGLSTSKSIAEDHNGSLAVSRSEPNTTFVLSLPAKQKTEPKPARTAA